MKVSVIVATHNRPGLLKEAVSSILGQTWQEFEVVIVDDASTDNTPQVIAGFADPRILSIRNERSGGPSVARNRGAQVAGGEILSFLDDDDFYLPEKLARTVEAFQRGPEIGVVISGFDNGALQAFPDFEGDAFKKLTSRFYTLPTSILAIRRTLFESLGGFDEALHPSEDIDLCLRASRVAKFASIHQPLVYHRQHGGPRLVDDLTRAERTFTLMVQKNLGESQGRRLFNSWKGQGCAGLARRNFLEGDRGKARYFSRMALRCEPLLAKRWAQFAVYHFMPRGAWFERLFKRRRVKL